MSVPGWLVAGLTTASLLSQTGLAVWSESSSRCEVCNTPEMDISDHTDSFSDLSISSVVRDMKSNGDDYLFEFYVSIELDHSYLGDLEIAITKDQDRGGDEYIFWEEECGSGKDLNALFYNSADETVFEQVKCPADRSTVLFAKPSKELLSISNYDDLIGDYQVRVSDEERADVGYWYKVCVGIFHQSGCVLNSDEDTIVEGEYTYLSTEEPNSPSEEELISKSGGGTDVTLIIILAILLPLGLCCICLFGFLFYRHRERESERDKQTRQIRIQSDEPENYTKMAVLTPSSVGDDDLMMTPDGSGGTITGQTGGDSGDGAAAAGEPMMTPPSVTAPEVDGGEGPMQETQPGLQTVTSLSEGAAETTGLDMEDDAAEAEADVPPGYDEV